jgi:glycosyltransferase involved in cell wall biosynthesis
MSPLATSSTTAPRIGVAIAVHNSWDVLADCLKALNASVTEAELSVVVCDDGSTDGTREELAAQFPSVRVVTGDGSLWWTGGTNRAVELCLVDGCDYVLLLNPDAFVAPGAIQRLLECSTERDDAVCAGLVVDRDAPEHIVWAGSRWGRVVTPLPVWTSRYIYRRGTEVASIPLAPYETSEVHGRGVLFPAAVMRRSGLPDDVGTLETRTSSMGMTGSAGAGWSFRDARSRFQRHLWDRKSGEQMSVWWTISRRHVPWYGALPTFGFIIGLGSFRFWQRELRQARNKTTGGSSR